MNTTSMNVREPDDVQHEFIGLMIILATALAAFCLVAVATGRLTAAITLVLVPSIVIAVDRRARRRHTR